MDTERAGKILEGHGLTKKAFADMMGVKPSTARMAFSLKRFSKRMVAKLLELESELKQEEQKEEREENKRLSVIEGVVRQTMDIPLEKMARVYAVPKNRFLRLIEFKDGTHGKFRCKPGKYLKLGEEVKVTPLKGDMWEVVKCG
jgi:plasmid maintenance system antidote protein VapI